MRIDKEDRKFLTEVQKQAREAFHKLDFYNNLVKMMLVRYDVDVDRKTEDWLQDFLYNIDMTIDEFLEKIKE